MTRPIKPTKGQKEKLKVLDLFSGIGGFSLGLERTGGVETVAFCEIDKFCQKVLKKHWPEVPIFEDVRTLDYVGTVDVITGGYPCQPFSVAGERKGSEDDRHLWPSMFDLIKKYRPTWVLGENVAGHISMGLDDVLSDLGSEGYQARTFVIPACALDAPHRRERLWIVAHADSQGKPDGTKHELGLVANANDRHKRQKETLCARRDAIEPCRENVSYTQELGRNGEQIESSGKYQGERERATRGCGGNVEFLASCAVGVGQKLDIATKPERAGLSARGFDPEWRTWLPEPGICRVVDGVSAGIHRTTRLKALGNSVVPQIPEMIGRAILEAESCEA